MKAFQKLKIHSQIRLRHNKFPRGHHLTNLTIKSVIPIKMLKSQRPTLWMAEIDLVFRKNFHNLKDNQLLHRSLQLQCLLNTQDLDPKMTIQV